METSLWAWLSIRTKMFSIAIGFSLATLFLYYIFWFDFDTGDDTFEFVGAFRFAGSCYIFVPKAKESKVKKQPTKAKLTKVTDLKEIASFC